LDKRKKDLTESDTYFKKESTRKGNIMSEERTVYDQFGEAFPNVHAAVAMRGNDPIGKVVIKGKTAYCHLYGTRMVKASVTGGGYDLATAACAKAAQKAYDQALAAKREMGEYERLFWAALIRDEGASWDTQLYRNGFNVHFVI
jgi:hypothetical protein